MRMKKEIFRNFFQVLFLGKNNIFTIKVVFVKMDKTCTSEKII